MGKTFYILAIVCAVAAALAAIESTGYSPSVDPMVGVTGAILSAGFAIGGAVAKKE